MNYDVVEIDGLHTAVVSRKEGWPNILDLLGICER